jgi:hypothetical protein
MTQFSFNSSYMEEMIHISHLFWFYIPESNLLKMSRIFCVTIHPNGHIEMHRALQEVCWRTHSGDSPCSSFLREHQLVSQSSADRNLEDPGK